MNCKNSLVLLLLLLSCPLFSQNPNPVLLQDFYWEVPIQAKEGNWWKKLEIQAESLKEMGIDAVWLPPPYKGASGIYDSGYGVYDFYDLGEFDQKGSVQTRYGSLEELQNAIRSFHTHGIEVYADIAMNHMIGADTQETFFYQNDSYKAWTRFRFEGRNGKYSSFQWNYSHFSGCKEKEEWKLWNPHWDFDSSPLGWDNLMGCEVRYQNPESHNEMITWGKWITEKLNLDGYRLDATKHIQDAFLVDWLRNVRGNRFAVSEAWLGGLGDLRQYLNNIKHESSVFDFPLLYIFRDVLNKNGEGDMRRLKFAGLTEVEGPYSVSFVENHDTARSDPQFNHKLLAYAYILMRDKGYPCLFYKDLYQTEYQEELKTLLTARKKYAYGSSWEHSESDEDVYVYSRLGNGNGTGLLLLLNDNQATSKRIKTHFPDEVLIDLSNHSSQIVHTDSEGYGTFPVPAHSYTLWVQK